jgi:hypothetical protein
VRLVLLLIVVIVTALVMARAVTAAEAAAVVWKLYFCSFPSSNGFSALKALLNLFFKKHLNLNETIELCRRVYPLVLSLLFSVFCCFDVNICFLFVGT